MLSFIRSGTCLVLLLGAVPALVQINPVMAADTHVSFDDVATGVPPRGWRIEATNPRGSLARWETAADPDAKSPPHVISLIEINDRSRGHFNLAWTPDIKFQNGEIQVAVRADSGRIDQGGGPMWRVRDADNYYVARYNPLESNFRIYYVRDGNRRELASAENLKIPAGRWFTIRIVQQADRIEGWVDGEKLLELHDDTFRDTGGVGLWTKADAATSFDELTVRSE